MLTTREWLIVIGIAVVGAAGTMVYRTMAYAFRPASGIALQSLSALLAWALVGAGAVLLLGWRSARNEQ